eukprot:357241-Chlamydomonas_euryale.AAC.6
MASARPCYTSNLLGHLKFHLSKIFYLASRQACLSKHVPLSVLKTLGIAARDQFRMARQLEKAPENSATIGAFLMAPPDCKDVHSKRIFNIPVTLSSLQLIHKAIFRK